MNRIAVFLVLLSGCTSSVYSTPEGDINAILNIDINALARSAKSIVSSFVDGFSSMSCPSDSVITLKPPSRLTIKDSGGCLTYIEITEPSNVEIVVTPDEAIANIIQNGKTVRSGQLLPGTYALDVYGETDWNVTIVVSK